MHLFRRSQLARLALAFMLAFAPLLAGAHATTKSGAAFTMPDHAHHTMSVTDHDHRSHHVEEGDAAGPSHGSVHDGCTAQCCAACGHCATATLAPDLLTRPHRAIRVPFISTLLRSRPVTVEHRPPQA
jgi:hypothetical protein